MSSEGQGFAFQSGDAEEGPAIHFVQKLLAFLEDPSSGLQWNEAGDAICVRDADEFAKNTLPLHFKHSNFASFVRQLHMYGFSKSPPLPPPARPVHEFRHRHLLRHDLSLARFIRRRNSAGASAGPVSISGASNELKLLSQQVRGVMERQADMERALMQQHEALRHENGMLWQQIEISRRNQDALNNKLSQVVTTFQHIANRLSTSRASKIVAHNTQQLIEYQDNAVDAEEDSNTPRKRAKEDIESLGFLPADAVFGQISQILRDGLSDASGISIAGGSFASALYPQMPPMITSPMQCNAARASEELPPQHTYEQLLQHTVPAQVQPQVSEIHIDPPNSPKDQESVDAVGPNFDPEKFRTLQSETQQLSEQLTDFELVWTPRSLEEADGAGLLKFPDDFSENENEWE